MTDTGAFGRADMIPATVPGALVLALAAALVAAWVWTHLVDLRRSAAGLRRAWFAFRLAAGVAALWAVFQFAGRLVRLNTSWPLGVSAMS